MSDEFDVEAADRRAAARGAQAAAELTLTDEAFAKLEAAAIEELLSSSSGQSDKRERLYQVANIVRAVRRALLDIVQAGEIARIALAKEDLLRP